MPTDPQHTNSYRSSALLICALISLVYCNTFDAAWHLDDFPNITDSAAVQINDLDWESLAKPFTRALSDGRLDRPLPRLTFALNWLVGKDAAEGYHLVNLAIHILNAWLLFLTARALFQTPNMRGVSRRDADFVCLLGAVIWAVNPIQTQAVTYIVQRMASMAALFSVLGLYAYVRARLIESVNQRCGWALICILSFALGMASKENAAVLPLTLFVCELCFFQDLRNAKARRRMTVVGLTGLVLLIALGSFVFLHGDPLAIFSYGNRFFSPAERLLTQSRVLVFYLSLIFYPAPTRLSIEHDFAVSTSLIQPLTTLGSVAILCALFGLAVLQLRKRPLLSFAILFFFINHLIESSIIGLELVFEHRNYLASMFVFFPVAAGLKILLNRYAHADPMRWVLSGFITLLIVGLGAGTYIRNQVWSSGRLLWEDAAGKAPESSRPLHNLAWDYYERIGDYRSALEIYNAALQRTKTNIHQESIILNNIASIYYTGGDYRRAAEYWHRSLSSYPGYSEIRYRLALALTRTGNFGEAETHLNELLAQQPAHLYASNLKGVLLLKRGQYVEGIRHFTNLLKAHPAQPAATINIGVACLLAGDLQRAEWFFKDACFRFPREKVGLLWLTLLEARIGNFVQANGHMRQLLDSVRLSDLLAWMPEGETVGLLRDSILLPHRDPEVLSLLNGCIGSYPLFERKSEVKAIETGLDRKPVG